jgi:hypothetical protein
MGHIYEDLGAITGVDGLMTHMLPNALRAATPWLEAAVTDQRYWDSAYDPNHHGDFALPEPTKADQLEMQNRYARLTSPLEKFVS